MGKELDIESNLLPERSPYSESFVNFVKEIVKTLVETKNVDMPEEFVLNMVKLAAINPDNKFLIKQQMVDTEIDRLKQIVVERIVGMSELSRNTIRMQMHYRETCKSRDVVIIETRKGTTEKVDKLIGELKHFVPKHRRHYDFYYAKLVGATIYVSNMGPDTEQAVVDDTQDALSKIFHKDDICLLSSMTHKERQLELMNIIGITCGYRLFEKDKHPDQYLFIEDLSKILPRKLQEALKQLQSMKSMHTERLIGYTTAIKKYFTGEINVRAGRRELSLEMVKARQGLSMVHQVLIYIRQLIAEMAWEEKHVSAVVVRYKAVLKELHGEKQRKNAAPTSSDYPKFLELGSSWQCLVDSNTFVNTRTQISMEIHQFAEKELLEVDDFIERMIKMLKRKLPSEEQFFNFPSLRVELDTSAQMKRIDYRPDGDRLDDIDFNGFCINTFVYGSGLSVLPNPNLGIFLWNDFKLLFATPDDAKEFSKNPDKCLRRAARIAQRWPELIILMNLEHIVYHPLSLKWNDDSKTLFNFMVSKNTGMQCETHPMPSNIVESYTWNEWELRRRGIILSKIHKCRTHGTQTHLQALRKTVESQTYAKKSQEMQTNRSVHTSVPQSKFYLAGLRGYNCGVPPHIVELTSENPEDLHCICKPLERVENQELLEPHDRHKRRNRKSISLQKY